ncbi:hypothetical protein ACWKSP_35915 [Micromonosporaceae bacterium Da 78-11]
MSDVPPVHGGIYPYQGIRRADFLVVSVNALNSAGTVILVEIADDAPTDLRGLLAVQLGEQDPLPGKWVLAWRINYANAGRLDVGAGHGTLSAETMIKVRAAVRSAIEPL